jgi:hypothetical protein
MTSNLLGRLALRTFGVARQLSSDGFDACADVRNYLDLSELEFRAGRVMPARLFATEIVTDNRRWQAFVSDQAVLDRVAEIDQLFDSAHHR